MNNSKTKGFHWGHGIILTFVLFGAFMAYFYFNMTHQVIELVGDHYYEDGKQFQKKIDLKNQRIPATDTLQIQLLADQSFLLVRLPMGIESASLQFFRPANSKQDKKLIWQAKDGEAWTIPSAFLTKGPWKYSISWRVRGHDYLREERLLID
jgi:nitrogen fixation protein FixH